MKTPRICKRFDENSGAGLLAGSIFGLDQYVRNIRKRYQGETDS